MSEWAKASLEKISTIIMGQSPSGDTYNFDSIGLPLLNGPTEFEKRYPHCTLFTTDSKRECLPGDLIFCVRGSTGRMNWADKQYSLGRGVCSIRGKSKLDTYFIKYCLDYCLIELLSRASGATFTNLKKDDIGHFEIPWPGDQVRGKIALILSAFDDLIENNNRRIKILEEMAQRLYKEWFVDFRFPGCEQAEFYDSGTEFGEIPVGWEVKKLGDVVELAYGKGLRTDDRSPGAIPVYGSSGIVGYHDESLVDGPGIVVGRKGNVGSVFWVNEDFYPIDTTYFVRSKLSLYYVFYLLQTLNFINNDAAVPGLNRNQAYALKVIKPSIENVTLFEIDVEHIFELKLNLEIQNRNLIQTRDLLLPRLMSGEVEV